MTIFNTHASPKSVTEASTLLAQANTKALAGGTDLLGVLKAEILPTDTETVVDLKSIPNLNTISVSGGVLKIGALAKLNDIANSSTVANGYSALSQAALGVASPQVRNMGTIGGNLAQSVRCWYYRFPDVAGGRFVCLRKGGTTCYGATGNNTYHSVFGGPKGCYSVYPSDTATALLALNASIVTSSRTIPIDNFFDALTGTVLNPGEIITEVDVPTPATGTTQTFLKFRLTNSVEFAIASVATMITMSGSTVSAARIALGGVAPTPLRSTAAENAIVGQILNATTAAAAASAAVASATPLPYNGYKVPILKGLLTIALTPSS